MSERVGSEYPISWWLVPSPLMEAWWGSEPLRFRKHSDCWLWGERICVLFWVLLTELNVRGWVSRQDWWECHVCPPRQGIGMREVLDQTVQLRFGLFCTESQGDVVLQCYHSQGKAPSIFSCLQGWDGGELEEWLCSCWVQSLVITLLHNKLVLTSF